MMILQILGALILGIVLIVLSYIFLALVCSLIPVNRKHQMPPGGYQIYLHSDGIHTDFVLPAIHQLFDWREWLDDEQFDLPFSEQLYLGFGWGDRGFYLDIPTWKDLTPKVAFNAMCVPSPTLMHVIAHPQLPESAKFFQAITLSDQQYLDLCSYIQSFFRQGENQTQVLPDKGYTPNDNFYLATRSYHAFHTCNYWVNRGLKRIGFRTALWSPASHGIFLHLK